MSKIEYPDIDWKYLNDNCQKSLCKFLQCDEVENVGNDMLVLWTNQMDDQRDNKKYFHYELDKRIYEFVMWIERQGVILSIDPHPMPGDSIVWHYKVDHCHDPLSKGFDSRPKAYAEGIKKCLPIIEGRMPN